MLKISRTSYRRPSRYIVGPLLALIVATSLVACGSDNSSSGGGKDFKVVVLSDGAKNDKSWSNSVYNGTTKTDKNVKATYVGDLQGPADYTQQASSYASQGYDMVIMAYGDESAAALTVAKQFPNVMVCQGPRSPSEKELAELPKNMCVWNLKQQDGTFLAGVVAGLVTKTGKIGAIDGGDFPAIVRQSEGFILGARCVNPDVTFTQQVTGSFTDVSAARSAAQSQIAAGADVILSAVDSAVSGIYTAAKDADHPTQVIPSYFDSYDQAPDVILTSVLYNLDGIVADLIKKGAAGDIEPRSYQPYNYANLKVGELADFHGNPLVTADVQKRYEDIRAKVADGTITVPDEKGADAPLSVKGAGSKISPQSIGCE